MLKAWMAVPPGTIIEGFNVIEHIRLCGNAGIQPATEKYVTKLNNMDPNMTTMKPYKDHEPN